MRRDDFLDTIGNVDDGLLAESEWFTHRRSSSILWKAVVAAAVVALMSLSVFAATKLLSRPVESGGIVTDDTIAPCAFNSGEIVLEPQVGLKVVMETQVDADAPTHLKEIYYLTMPDGWTSRRSSWGESNYFYSSMEYIWTTDGKAGEIRFEQKPGSNYVNSDHAVDYLNELPLDTAVRTQIVHLADMELLQLYIPPVKLDGYADQNVAYYENGEYRLYWSDGRYMFHLDYPSWLTEAEVEHILRGIDYETFTPQYPEGYGTIVLDRIQSMLPKLGIQKGNTGTTIFNNATSMGNMVYRDGMFYFSEPERLFIYNSNTSELQTAAVEGGLFPTYMFLAEDHLLFADSWQENLYAMDLKTKQIEVVYQGLGNEGLYADGMTLYAIHEGVLQQINLETGVVNVLAQNIRTFCMDDTHIVAIPDTSNTFLLADRTDQIFEEISLTFQPSENVILKGEDIYFSVAASEEETNHWQLVKWNNGVETPLDIQCGNGQFVGSTLYYFDGNLLKSYNTETGQTALLFENCGNLTVHENRYLTVQHILNRGWSILDLETGETTYIDYPEM